MAIFGTLKAVKDQVNSDKFKKAFEYLEQAFQEGTIENKRLSTMKTGAFEKVVLDEKNFALEQVYNTKERKNCFFESHKKYIDVQFIVEGEKIIEVADVNDINIDADYDSELDLLKYKHASKASIIKLKKGDIAIFYPRDAHMPCVQSSNSQKVVKTVVKVAV